ncbi:MAG: phosphatase [Bacteroidetes bacterium]|nr:MAG: phosphatase [Bacteroidota bacterium]
MIQFVKGNLLESKADALVNTVNTVGVMGKGIALQFKEAFPNNYQMYREVCKKKELDIAKLLIIKEINLKGELKWIINFPTKKDWKQKSEYQYIELGLEILAQKILELNIKSIALPPLGCGNGGLEWEKVRSMMIKYLENLEEVEIMIYEPNQEIKNILQIENTQKTIKLTPARAILLYALFNYEKLGEDISLFVANKIAYFLQRLGENLKINFVASHYGPYSVQIAHVLYTLNGVYLKGLEQKNSKPFETLYLNDDKFEEVQNFVQENLSQTQKQRLEDLLFLLNGFQSALSLEILATIDFVSQKEDLEIQEIRHKIDQWSGRKEKLFKDQYIQIAFKHLSACKRQMNFF